MRLVATGRSERRIAGADNTLHRRIGLGKGSCRNTHGGQIKRNACELGKMSPRGNAKLHGQGRVFGFGGGSRWQLQVKKTLTGDVVMGISEGETIVAMVDPGHS